MRIDIGTLDSGERSLPFGLLVSVHRGIWISTTVVILQGLLAQSAVLLTEDPGFTSSNPRLATLIKK